MNHVNLFLILIIVLVVLLFVLVILLVTFRKTIETQCCRHRRESDASEVVHRGLRNPAFDDQEHPFTIQPRPFNNMEATESPPSYEEAIKQELFRFRLPIQTRTRSNSLGEGIATRNRDSPSTSFSEEVSVVDSPPPPPPMRPESSPSLPSTSQEACSSRSRSSTTNSCLASHLSTIEEEGEDSPVTVVIDCIGIQAARLMEKCDITVDLATGDELTSHSKC